MFVILQMFYVFMFDILNSNCVSLCLLELYVYVTCFDGVFS